MIRHSDMVLPVIGVTLAAFASGFGVCVFNLDTVGACLNVAQSWVAKFQIMGNHIIAWALAMMHGIANLKH